MIDDQSTYGIGTISINEVVVDDDMLTTENESTLRTESGDDIVWE